MAQPYVVVQGGSAADTALTTVNAAMATQTMTLPRSITLGYNNVATLQTKNDQHQVISLPKLGKRRFHQSMKQG